MLAYLVTHLALSWNRIGAQAEGAGRPGGGAGGLQGAGIGAEGAGRLAGVLGECKVLEHLDLSFQCKEIEDEEPTLCTESHAARCCHCSTASW